MTAAIKYTRVGGGPANGDSYRQMADMLQSIFEEELTEVGKEGVQIAQDFIETAGTGKTWTGRFKGREGAPAGRIDSGSMRDNISYRIYRGQGVGLDIGWVNFWEEYYGAQELGFSAGGFRPSQAVEGMGMLAHLRVVMRAKVDAALDRAERRILDGL